MPSFATPNQIHANIDIVAGEIRIIASDRADTVVEVHAAHAPHEPDIKAATQVQVDFADGVLTVKTPKTLQLGLFRRMPAIQVTIQLPTDSTIEANSVSADTRCEGRLGDCGLRTVSGDISLQEAAGLRVTTASGAITIGRVAGDAVTSTASGDVRITEVGGAANVKVASGRCWIGQVHGEANVRSASGGITIDVAGPRVAARSASGKIRLNDLARGSANLHTASGKIEVGIRPGTAAWVEASSAIGQVRNELQSSDGPAGQQEKAQIQARTATGDIIIRRAEEASVTA